jgi:hypothetical protein
MTMALISTITVGAGGAAAFTFSNIPQSFTDLLLVASVRIGTTTGNTWGDAGLTFNGVATGYSGMMLYGTGSGAGSVIEGTSSYIVVRVQSNDGSANVFSNTSLHIPNYTSANSKSISYDSVTENNATSSIQTISTGLWNNTAAITSLTLSTTTFVQNSTVSLYGILKGSGGATVS